MMETLISIITTLPPWVSAILFLIILIGLILLGVPVTFSIGLTSILYMLLYRIDIGTVYRAIMIPLQSFPLLGVFLFTFMGVVFEKAKLTEIIVDAIQPLVGRVKGGLGVVVALGCAFYGLLTGAVAATAAAFSRMLGPEMERRGYPREYVAALLSSSAPLGAFIPPSIPAIIIAVSIGGSVLTMFLVGASLGLVVLLGLIIVNLAISHLKGFGRVEKVYTRREILINIAKALPLLAVPLSVLGGIYLGVFSVTEAGALGAIGALIVAIAYRRLKPHMLVEIFIESGKTTAVVMLMIATSYILSFTWSLSGINNALLGFFVGIARTYSPLISLTILAVLLFILGMFFDVIVLAIAWGSVIVSALSPYGINLYHIGGLFLMGVLIGTATPPVGAGVFVVSGSLKIEIERILKGMKWFLVLYFILYVLAIYVPDLSLWLPKLLKLI